ncbi:MAG: hypothetical protein K9K93_02425 [Acholeplasmataceae bacterium]|nr:hypothetical protein [Acholeplasmataceae bacterium]
MTKTLNGPWTLEIPHLNQTITGNLPGSVYTDLLHANLIPDPYAKDNEHEVRSWMGHDYIYSRAFDHENNPLEKTYLSFQSIDTIATVKLNDVVVLTSSNMHIRHMIDVTDVIVSGSNRLSVLLESPIKAIEEAKANANPHLFEITDAISGYSLIRKAHSMFGWDWGPQLPDAGVYGDIGLVSSGVGLIEDPVVRQIHTEDHVKVMIDPVVRDAKEGILETVIKDPDGHILMTSKDYHVEITIRNPRLWWPRGYGDQPLYTIDMTLFDQDIAVDRKTIRIGLRTGTFDRTKDTYGESFAYVHNGFPVFMKGANYIIEDNILARMSEARTAKLFDDLCFANHNTIRVWGGGIYPPDWFYRIADEKGILVWQDFMFACSGYNSDDHKFIQSLEAEIRDVVKRISHHPSIALLCGNNEVETAIEDWSVSHQALTKRLYVKLFEQLIPTWLEEIGSMLFYWPSSPSSGGAFDHPNDHARGDMHDWSVWHGNKPIEDYRRHIPRFMSEFGLQSFPELDTVLTFAEEKDLHVYSKVMKSHQKNKTANKKIVFYMKKMFQMPKSFEDILYVSQLIQAEGIRYGVEHFRRHLGISMGSLYWQLNDCWPVASWSSIDYHGRYKALHYHSRKFYADLLVSICEDKKKMTADIVITNDRKTSFSGIMKSRLITIDGLVLDEVCQHVDVHPFQALTVLKRDDIQFKAMKKRLLVDVSLEDNTGHIRAFNQATYVYDRDLELIDSEIKTTVNQDNGITTITLSADTLHRFVWLKYKDERFSDNFFHALPNRSVTITMTSQDDVSEIRRNLKVRSLISTYMDKDVTG